MADNLGLMMIAGGAALIGALVLTQKKSPEDELEKETAKTQGKRLGTADPKSLLETVQVLTTPAGTVKSINGKDVIPAWEPLAWEVELYNCTEVGHDDSGKPMCKVGGDWIYLPKPSDPPSSKFYGIKRFLGFGRGNQVPARAGEGVEHQLYVFSGDPVIDAITTTRGRPLGVGGHMKDSFMDTGASEKAYWEGRIDG
jgi:hypothetical protein